jgi:hypothetical protein
VYPNTAAKFSKLGLRQKKTFDLDA